MGDSSDDESGADEGDGGAESEMPMGRGGAGDSETQQTTQAIRGKKRRTVIADSDSD